MSLVDTVLLIVSMSIVVGVSSLLPIMAWKDYKYEKARNRGYSLVAKQKKDKA